VRNTWTRRAGDAPDLLVGGRLSAAKRIILIGHGPGVVGISELLEARTAGVMRHVKLVVQVVGYTKIPLVPKKGPDLITWYQKHSLVIIPQDHVIRYEGKILKRHGRLVFAEESKPVKLMLRALPLIQTHVRNVLTPTGVPE